MAWTGPTWRSRDGIHIPVHGTPERHKWDYSYHQAVINRYSNGDESRLKLIVVDPKLCQGSNLELNPSRTKLYGTMLSGGDVLPPIVVRRSPEGWFVVDGNVRHQTLLAAGEPATLAYEILDEPTQKAEIPTGTTSGFHMAPHPAGHGCADCQRVQANKEKAFHETATKIRATLSSMGSKQGSGRRHNLGIGGHTAGGTSVQRSGIGNDTEPTQVEPSLEPTRLLPR